MSHWIVAPVLWPLVSGAVLLLLASWYPAAVRTFSLASAAALLGITVLILGKAATGEIGVYLLGNWPAPFGIVLMVDRLSAMLLLLTGFVGLAGLAFAARGEDRAGVHFHPLYHFQLMGLNGAFVTGDLFTLFVCFELLLIASYGLLLQGSGRDQLRMGLRVVAVNLTGSALFLVAVTLLYSAAGTLNLADLGLKLAALPEQDTGLAHAGIALLLVVFALKAAVLPLNFWLPGCYAAAGGAVAAVFAVLTKVGVYAILRVTSLLLAPDGVDEFAASVFLPLALATVVVATFGMVAARDLRHLTGYLVVVSAGTLLAAIALPGGAGIPGALVYLVHSTVAAAALFLLAAALRGERGSAQDRFEPGPAVVRPLILGGLWFVAAVGAAGLPPLSGFVGKLFILESALMVGQGASVLPVVLGSSALILVAFSRAGSTLFWNTTGAAVASRPGVSLAPILLLLGAQVLLAVFAGPMHSYASAAAQQLLRPAAVQARVQGEQPAQRPGVSL